MWSKWQDEHRVMGLMALKLLQPVTSVYELGCGSGPNLRLLKEYWPVPLVLGGSEPSPGLAAWASEHLGIHIDQSALPEVPEDSWDVVLTCYALAYVEPEDVLATFAALKARAMVILEPNGAVQGAPAGLMQMTDGGNPVGVPEWHHDYPSLLAETGWRMTWRWPMTKRVHGLNAVLIAERS
jgi:trans-aconitate methyltransferase